MIEYNYRKYLAEYKRSRLGVSDSGEYEGKEYAHILPKKLQKLNILEPIRKEFWTYCEKNNIRLHKYFHHLNSSQAMCFNLFFPIILLNRLDLLNQTLKVGNSIVEASFEKILDKNEGTNFDLYLLGSDGTQTFVEVKYSENEFGRARPNKERWDKLETIYRDSLSGLVDNEFIERSFFDNYQVLRLLSYLRHGERGGMNYVRIIIPKWNKSLLEHEKKITNNILAETAKRNVEFIYLEDIVTALEKALAGEVSVLAACIKSFREKYCQNQ
jgi:hypothetical protein